MRPILLPLHIIAGLTAILTGFTALYALKGAAVHKRSGLIFVCAMLIMAGSGATLAVIKSQPANIIGGFVAIYLVSTGFLTLDRRDGRFHPIDAAAMALAVTIGVASTTLGVSVLHNSTGTIDGAPPVLLFVFGAVTLLAALGDLRMILARGIHGKPRLVRHLWRMCFATFVATGSFFIGQAKVFPKPMRIFPLLAIPAFLPLVLMLYWLARMSLKKWRPGHITESLQPTSIGYTS